MHQSSLQVVQLPPSRRRPYRSPRHAADLLGGDYKQADYGKVILPFTILRRLDCVLDKTREKILQRYETLKGGQVKNLEPVLNRISGVPFHNTAKFTFEKLRGDPE